MNPEEPVMYRLVRRVIFNYAWSSDIGDYEAMKQLAQKVADENEYLDVMSFGVLAGTSEESLNASLERLNRGKVPCGVTLPSFIAGALNEEMARGIEASITSDGAAIRIRISAESAPAERKKKPATPKTTEEEALYKPRGRELKRWEFARWLVQTGKLGADDQAAAPVD